MAGNNNSKRSPEEIRREIEATRGSMTGKISQLETQLNPQRLKQEATDKIRENTVGRVEHFADNAKDTVKGAGTDVFESIKENPIPAALTFIGLGWLFMESRNKAAARLPAQPRYGQAGSNTRYDRYDPYYGSRYEASRANVGYSQFEGEQGGRMQEMRDQVQDKAQHAAGSVQDKAHQVKGSVQDTAEQVKDSVQDTAEQMKGSVQDTASQVKDQAQQFAGQAQEQVGEWADAAQEQAYVIRSRFEELLDENPLLVGAAAMALGAAIGLSLPGTRKEDELFGQARDDVMEKAQAKASETAEKVQTVAQKTFETTKETVKETVKDEAQKQNLTSGS